MSKETILQRLKKYPVDPQAVKTAFEKKSISISELVDSFSENLEAVKGRVIRCTADTLQQQLNNILIENGVQQLCAGTDETLTSILDDLPENVKVRRFDQAVEHIKEELFCDMDAGLTRCNGALANTGSIILLSAPTQPRLVSLVPPIHIVLLTADQIFADMSQWIEKSELITLPSNLLFITGPSKSADIEQILTYGVHGPKQFIVLLKE